MHAITQTATFVVVRYAAEVSMGLLLSQRPKILLLSNLQVSRSQSLKYVLTAYQVLHFACLRISRDDEVPQDKFRQLTSTFEPLLLWKPAGQIALIVHRTAVGSVASRLNRNASKDLFFYLFDSSNLKQTFIQCSKNNTRLFLETK